MTLVFGELPTIVFHSPECSHCSSTLEQEERTMWCTECRVVWDSSTLDSVGAPDRDYEDSDVKCAEVRPTALEEYDFKDEWITITYQPCILPTRHKSEHLWPYTYERAPLQGERRPRP